MQGTSYEYISFVEIPRQMGHTVHHLDHILMASWDKEHFNDIFMTLVKTGFYDLILVQTFQEEFFPEVLEEAKKHTVTLAWNCDDDWRWENYSSKWVQYYSFMVTTYRNIYEGNKSKFSNLILSQWGCTGISDGLTIKKALDFSFVGGFHGSRKQQILYLKKKVGIISYGNGAPPSGLINRMRCILSKAGRLSWIPPNSVISDQIQVNEIWNRSKISFTPLESSSGDKIQIKARIFDMGLSGTLMICNENPLLEEFYRENIEYISYKGIEECADKVRFFLANDSARKLISQAYYLRTKTEHTWPSRFEKIFKEIGLINDSKHSGLPKAYNKDSNQVSSESSFNDYSYNLVPRVSVLMIAFNAEYYLRQAINSILVQDFTDFELIIIDDKSTDNSYEILNSYNDPRVKIFFNTSNLGVTASRQIALSKCTGEFVAVLDADDVAYSNRLSLQVSYLDKHSEISLLCGSASIISETGEFLCLDSPLSDPLLLKWQMFFRNPIIHSTVMFRKKDVCELGGYEGVTLAEDFNLWGKLMRNGLAFSAIPETIVMLRQHRDQTSRCYKQELINDSGRILAENIFHLGIDVDKEDIKEFLLIENEKRGIELPALVKTLAILNKINQHFTETYILDRKKIRIIVLSQFIKLRSLIDMSLESRRILIKNIRRFVLKQSFSILFEPAFLKAEIHHFIPNWLYYNISKIKSKTLSAQ